MGILPQRADPLGLPSDQSALNVSSLESWVDLHVARRGPRLPLPPSTATEALEGKLPSLKCPWSRESNIFGCPNCREPRTIRPSTYDHRERLWARGEQSGLARWRCCTKK